VRKDVKLLGNGELKKALTINVHAASATAREKIEAAGGTLVLLREPKAKKARRQRAAAPASETEAEAPAADEPESEA
jgi:large subunit ribosomal protein L15